MFTTCGIKHRRCCLLAASSVLYTTSCKHSLVLLRMSEIIARNMLGWLGLLVKTVIVASSWLFEFRCEWKSYYIIKIYQTLLRSASIPKCFPLKTPLCQLSIRNARYDSISGGDCCCLHFRLRNFIKTLDKVSKKESGSTLSTVWKPVDE